MSDRRQIAIPDLLKLTKKLVKSTFSEHDFYSLLVLAMMTVTEYSRRKHHLTTSTRIDLSITFIPDLIQYLYTKQIITSEEMIKLNQSYQNKYLDLPLIMRSYTHISSASRPKIETRSSKEIFPCLIQ